MDIAAQQGGADRSVYVIDGHVSSVDSLSTHSEASYIRSFNQINSRL